MWIPLQSAECETEIFEAHSAFWLFGSLVCYHDFQSQIAHKHISARTSLRSDSPGLGCSLGHGGLAVLPQHSGDCRPAAESHSPSRYLLSLEGQGPVCLLSKQTQLHKITCNSM